MNAKKRMGPIEVAFVEPRIKFYICILDIFILFEKKEQNETYT
jgi:hypothetical protein